MREHGRDTIWWGDLEELEEIARRAGMKAAHPLRRLSRVLDGIARGRQFRQGRIKHGRRWCRAFTLQRG
jgi:hypothetical protein